MDRDSRSAEPVTLVSLESVTPKLRKLVRRWFALGWMMATVGAYARWVLDMPMLPWLLMGGIACIISYGIIDQQVKKL